LILWVSISNHRATEEEARRITTRLVLGFQKASVQRERLVVLRVFVFWMKVWIWMLRFENKNNRILTLEVFFDNSDNKFDDFFGFGLFWVCEMLV
jgi:hypothetical protein